MALCLVVIAKMHKIIPTKQPAATIPKTIATIEAGRIPIEAKKEKGGRVF
jgi:hypothetical protein